MKNFVLNSFTITEAKGVNLAAQVCTTILSSTGLKNMKWKKSVLNKNDIFLARKINLIQYLCLAKYEGSKG